MQTLRAAYTSPINALRPVTAQMHALIGTDWSDYTPARGHWLPRLDQLTPIFGRCAYDPDPARTLETFVAGYAYTSEWDSECAYQQQVAESAGGPPIDAVACIKPSNDTLTLRCAQLWPACPDPEARVSDPWTYQQWNNGSTPYCPVYCLNPTRFGNSFVNFLYQYSNPFAAQIEEIAKSEAAKGNSVNMWYWDDKKDLYRMYPSAETLDYRYYWNNSGVVSLEPGTDYSTMTYYPYFQVMGPGFNPGRGILVSSPYIDAMTGNPMVTAGFPMYESGVGPVGSTQSEFLGNLLIDIVLTGINQRVQSFVDSTGVPLSMSLIVDVDTGALVAVNPSGADLIFCPSAVLCDADGHFTSMDPLFLHDSSYPEWENQLLPLAQYDHSLYPSDADTLPVVPPVKQTRGVLLRGILYDVYSCPFPLYGQYWSQLLLVPSQYQEHAAVWSASPSLVLVEQPRIGTEADTISGLKITEAGVLLSPQQQADLAKPLAARTAVSSVVLFNVGFSDVAFAVSASAPWISVRVGTAVGSVTHLPGVDLSLLTSDVLQQHAVNQSVVPLMLLLLNNQSSVQLDVLVDWSHADRSVDALLTVTPNVAAVATSTCFTPLLLPVSLKYASLPVVYDGLRLDSQVAPSGGIIAYLIALAGAFVAYMLVEDSAFHARQRKTATRMDMLSFAAAGLTLGAASLWPSWILAVSQLELHSPDGSVGFGVELAPVKIMCSLVILCPVLALGVWLKVRTLGRQTARGGSSGGGGGNNGAYVVRPVKKSIQSTTDDPDKSHIGREEDEVEGEGGEGASTASTREEAELEADAAKSLASGGGGGGEDNASVVKTLLVHFGRAVLAVNSGSILLTLLLLSALVSLEVLGVLSLVSPSTLSVDCTFLIVGCVVVPPLLLLSVQLMFHLQHATWLSCFVLAVPIVVAHVCTLNAVRFEYDSMAAYSQSTNSSSVAWSRTVLVLVSVLLAAVCCFVLLVAKFHSNKLTAQSWLRRMMGLLREKRSLTAQLRRTRARLEKTARADHQKRALLDLINLSRSGGGVDAAQQIATTAWLLAHGSSGDQGHSVINSQLPHRRAASKHNSEVSQQQQQPHEEHYVITTTQTQQQQQRNAAAGGKKPLRIEVSPSPGAAGVAGAAGAAPPVFDAPSRSDFLQLLTQMRASAAASAAKASANGKGGGGHGGGNSAGAGAYVSLTSMLLAEGIDPNAKLGAPAAAAGGGRSGGVARSVSMGTLGAAHLAPVTLDSVLRHPFALERLRAHMRGQLAEESLAFWLGAALYSSEPDAASRAELGHELFHTFIRQSAPQQVNVSSTLRDAIQRKVAAGQWPLDLFTQAQTEVHQLIAHNAWASFEKSSEYTSVQMVMAMLPYTGHENQAEQQTEESAAAAAAAAAATGGPALGTAAGGALTPNTAVSSNADLARPHQQQRLGSGGGGDATVVLPGESPGSGMADTDTPTYLPREPSGSVVTAAAATTAAAQAAGALGSPSSSPATGAVAAGRQYPTHHSPV